VKQLEFFLAEAWEYFRRGKGATVATLIALTAVLFLFALVLVATHNVERVADRLHTREGISVFLSPGLSATRVEALATQLRGFGEVAEVRVVDPDVALAELEAELGGFSLEETFGENPLPHTLEARLRPEVAAGPGRISGLAGEIRALEDVDDVVYGAEWMERLERNLGYLRLGSLVVGALAALASGVVLFTTLNLVFVGRRETLRILDVVGATHEFIRSPFLLLGGLQCLFAAALALLGVLLARGVLATWLPDLAFLSLGGSALFLVGSFFFGLGASYLAIEPALRSLESGPDELLR